jgi:hypothetical protein
MTTASAVAFFGRRNTVKVAAEAEFINPTFRIMGQPSFIVSLPENCHEIWHFFILFDYYLIVCLVAVNFLS